MNLTNQWSSTVDNIAHWKNYGGKESESTIKKCPLLYKLKEMWTKHLQMLDALLHRRDSVAVLPTGYGKTLVSL